MKEGKSDLIILLGAGAMVNAGLPTAISLTGYVEKDVQSNYPELIPLVSFLEGAIQFGRGIRGELKREPINIEELLNAVSFLNTRSQHFSYPFIASWHERVYRFDRLPESIARKDVATSYELLLTYSKERLRSWLTINEEADLGYLEKFLGSLVTEHTLRIFSLNYDNGIEIVLEKTLGEINNKWTNGFDENGWNPALFDRQFDACLYKLHGSLDWVRDTKIALASVRWPTAQGAETIPDDYDPFLIFGTDRKFQTNDPFLTLLYQFRQALSTNKLLVVIGYSFGDEHINSMIEESFQNPEMKVIVADKDGLDRIRPGINLHKFLESKFYEERGEAKTLMDSETLLNRIKNADKLDPTPF